MFGNGKEPLDELDGSGVGPVKIFDRDHHRPVVGEPLEQHPDNLERPILEGFRRELDQASGRIGLEGETEHRAEVRIRLERAIREQLLEAATQRYAHAQLGFVGSDSEPISQQVSERPVRDRFSVGRGAPFDPELTPSLARRVLEDALQFSEQTALPDPRLAGDEQDPAGPPQSALDCLTTGAELVLPSNEPSFFRQEPRSGSRRPSAGNRVRGDWLRLSLQLELARLAPGKERLCAPAGLVGDEHCARLGGGLQPGRRVDRVTESRVLDSLSRTERAENDRPCAHADPDRESFDPPAAGDLESVLLDLLDDAKRGADGSFLVIFVGGRGAEEG